ncbi:integrator complex subunit 10 isoform X3 [Rhipicephalus microplus]|uniref:integrator complex subunit 10 isoform X3 n=1 Tax=Rhipicephalus microplus TaxID=6941 RepID=UPI003F6C45DF
MAPGSKMKENETDEEYLISMARSCQKSDPYFTKSWMLTAKTLFPDNFGIQYEAYCLASDSGNIKEASGYLEEMFRKFPTEHRLWDEVYKIANALRADTLDPKIAILRDMFNHLPTASQHDILLSIAEHCMDTAEHCRLMLLLLRKFPEKVVEHGVKLIDTLQMAEKHSHSQTPLNQFRKLLVCDVAPLVLKMGVELPVKQTYRLIHKCIEFYTMFIYAPNRNKLDLFVKPGLEGGGGSSSTESGCGTSEAELWRQLFSFMLCAGRRLRWELSELLQEPLPLLQESHWQHIRALLRARPPPPPTDLSAGAAAMDPEELVASHKQVFYCVIVIFLHALYNYGKHINPSWFPGTTSDIQCILLEGPRWVNPAPEQPKHKRRKVEPEASGKETEPPALTVSKCVPAESAVVLTQSFLTAIRCWSILQYLKKELSRLSQHIRLDEWPWFQSFLIESLIYQDQHKEAIAKLFSAADAATDPTTKNKVNLQMASCFYSCGESSFCLQADGNPVTGIKAACSKLLDVVCSLPENSVAASATPYHTPEALHRKPERKLVFACYERTEVLRFCMKTLITCFKEKVLMQFSRDDLALGHLIVMTQYDWPEEEPLFVKLLDVIKKQGNFCYGLFFNYLINADMLEEFMYITTANGGGVTLDLLPTSTTQVGRQRAVTRGVNKGAKEDLKLAMEKQMARCDDDLEHLLVHFVQQEREILEQQL